VLENRPADCEVLVVHNRPYDDPYDLAGEVRFVQANPRAGLAECLDMGTAASRAPVVHSLACGVEVFAGWADVALRHFQEPGTAAIGAVILRRDDLRKLVSAGVSYRIEGAVCRVGDGEDAENATRAQDELCFPDVAAGFYRKSALAAAGGFGSWTDAGLISADTALRMGQLGFRCVVARQCLAKTDPATLRRAPAFRLGRESERLFWRWAPVHGRWQPLALHAALMIGECAIGPCRPTLFARLAGRLCGAVGVALHGARPTPFQVMPPGSPEVVVLPSRPPQAGGTPAPQILPRRDSAPGAECQQKSRKGKAA
jgi:hypothetical protein